MSAVAEKLYVFGESQDQRELERLRAIEAVRDPSTRHACLELVFEAVGIAPRQLIRDGTYFIVESGGD